MSIVVPIAGFKLQSGALVTADKDVKQRIRVKYSAGANEAQGFRHCRQLTVGIEVVK